MELKKSPKANLDKYGNLMIFIGFLLMSWTAYALINWRQTTTEEEYVPQEIVYQNPKETFEIEVPKQKPPPPPPKPKVKVKVEVPKVLVKVEKVENDEEVKKIDVPDIDEPPPPPPPPMQNTPGPPAKPQKADIKKVRDVFTYRSVYYKPVVPGCEGKKGKELDACNNKMIQRELQRRLEYPEEAIEEQRMGTTYVKFTIDIQGIISNVRLIRGSKSKDLDQAALEGVSRMFRSKKAKNRIKPGRNQSGQPVKVDYQVPVGFRLDV